MATKAKPPASVAKRRTYPPAVKSKGAKKPSPTYRRVQPVERPRLPRVGTTRPPERGPLHDVLLGQVAGFQISLELVESSLHLAVVQARAEGATWQEIADALGVSVKVAWGRYTEDSRWAS